MRDPIDTRANEALDKAQRQLQDRKAREHVEDLKWLLAHRQGRRLAWQWMAEARVFHSTFNHSGSVMAHNEGRRSMGLQLLTEIMEHSPEAFTQMQKEAKADDH